MAANAVAVAPAEFAMPSIAPANLPAPSLPSDSATFSASTEPKNFVISPTLPFVALKTSSSTPANPLLCNALESNSMPNVLAASVASLVGAMMFEIAPLMPVIACDVGKP